LIDYHRRLSMGAKRHREGDGPTDDGPSKQEIDGEDRTRLVVVTRKGDDRRDEVDADGEDDDDQYAKPGGGSCCGQGGVHAETVAAWDFVCNE
jgi:hypothetical protein